MYSVESAACQPNAATPSTIAPGPSSASESTSSGTGTTVADHTVSESPPVIPEARETTLPIPHDSAPSRQSSRAAAVTCPPRPRATTASPAVPSTTPTTCRPEGRSRSTPAAITIVKMTCACRISAARPGGRPAAIATYRNPNCPIDMKTPTATTVRHGAAGLGTSSTAGKITSANRAARKSSAGTSAIPQSITTKLKPQMVATRAARRESRRFTGPAWPPRS